VLEIGPEDRTFSVAKLFFAYGLATRSTSVPRRRLDGALSGPTRAGEVFEVITRERPTLFYAVPTA